MDLVVQALVNGLVSGALLAVPAIGFTAMFAVLGFPNFSISGIATLGAFDIDRPGECVWSAAGEIGSKLLDLFGCGSRYDLVVRMHHRLKDDRVA